MLGLFLLLAFGLNGYSQTTVKTNQQSSVQPVQSTKKIGAFTNMRFTAEHQYGYTVELWQEKDRVFGFFLASEGLIGDTPTGLLEDVAFDSKTGQLSFRSRLSTGITFDKNDKQVPTRDVFRFKGVLKNRKLTGILENANDLAKPTTSRQRKFSLNFSKSETAEMIDAKSYDDWKKEADEILKFRGPKW